MKREIRALLTVLTLCALLCVSAAAKTVCGICAVDTAEGVTLVPDGTVRTEGGDTCYDGAEKLTLHCDCAAGQYLVLVLSRETAVPAEADIMYMDQTEADASGLSLTVYPRQMTDGTTYYVYLCGGGVMEKTASYAYYNKELTCAAHRYVQQPDGAIVCAVCGDETTFDAAAQYVGSRGGTLTLCEDTEAAYLLLGSDSTLDLGGSTLTVANGLSVSKGGTVKNGTLRIRSGAVAELNDNGGFVPVWTKTEGGYAYYTLCSLEMKLGKTVERYENGAKYTFGYKFAEYPTYALAINANANTDLKFGAELTVRNGEDSLRMDSSFSKGSIAKMDEVEDEPTAFYRISLRITGASPDRFSAAPMVKSKSIGYRMSGAK